MCLSFDLCSRTQGPWSLIVPTKHTRGIPMIVTSCTRARYTAFGARGCWSGFLHYAMVPAPIDLVRILLYVLLDVWFGRLPYTSNTNDNNKSAAMNVKADFLQTQRGINNENISFGKNSSRPFHTHTRCSALHNSSLLREPYSIFVREGVLSPVSCYTCFSFFCLVCIVTIPSDY